MTWLADPAIWTSLVTLTGLEIVLGVDNLVFIALLAARLPPGQQTHARRLGLALALVSRLVLLWSIVWLVQLTRPVLTIAGHDLSWRDLVLIAGGLFLLVKGCQEIRRQLRPPAAHAAPGGRGPGFAGTVAQIMLFDIIFSLDSVITAVGIAQEIWVMVAAVVIAMALMLVASGPLAAFIERHASVRMLALSFLLLIGIVLLGDGAGLHIARSTIYAVMGFAVLVEALNRIAEYRRKGAIMPANAIIVPAEAPHGATR